MHSEVNIPNARPGEKVEVVLRRHWIVYFILALYFKWWVIASIFGWYFFWLNPLFNIAIIVFWMGFSLFLYMEWLNHELDMYVITNNRIIGIEQVSFLNRVVSECNLGQVQEVNSSTKWLFSNILNYGTVTIQTAGRSSHFAMEFCPDVLTSQRHIINVVDHYRDEESKKKQEA